MRSTASQRWLYDPPWREICKAADMKLRAPLLRPPKIICVGLNYRDHALETKMEIPEVPTIFAKFPNAAIGCGEPIVLPRNSAKPDYEAELAFVIGKHGRHIPAEHWRDYVFGYTNFNDVSARDFQMQTSQWMIGKTFDTFAPMGPAIVTADEIPDPHALDISTIINGEVLQHSNTNDLIFKIPELIAHLSERLHAGAGRCDRHRHALRRRLCAQAAALAEAGRRGCHPGGGPGRAAESGRRGGISRRRKSSITRTTGAPENCAAGKASCQRTPGG